jgi:hypothetical protein
VVVGHIVYQPTRNSALRGGGMMIMLCSQLYVGGLREKQEGLH